MGRRNSKYRQVQRPGANGLGRVARDMVIPTLTKQERIRRVIRRYAVLQTPGHFPLTCDQSSGEVVFLNRERATKARNALHGANLTTLSLSIRHCALGHVHLAGLHIEDPDR